MKRNLSILIALALALWGCAAQPRQELQAARMALAQAYAIGAEKLAPLEYRAASAALSDGEDLVRRGRYAQAREILPFAEAHAQEAALKARQQQTDLELRKLRQQKETAAMKTESPQASPMPKVVKKALTQPAALKPPPLPPQPPPLHYTVADGETLWTIAARQEVYFDSLLWPLLYKANRDQIKDPRQIYPGQVLNVPRDLTREEQEEARETARASDIFPVENMAQSPSSGN
jgi:nucleoid-associated protein YgaU